MFIIPKGYFLNYRTNHVWDLADDFIPIIIIMPKIPTTREVNFLIKCELEHLFKFFNNRYCVMKIKLRIFSFFVAELYLKACGT